MESEGAVAVVAAAAAEIVEHSHFRAVNIKLADSFLIQTKFNVMNPQGSDSTYKSIFPFSSNLDIVSSTKY